MRDATQAIARPREEPHLVPDLEREYRLHGPHVAKWAVRLGGPGVDVEDVIQEVFFQAQRDLGSFRSEASFATWLYRITFNVILQRRRRSRLLRWVGLSREVEEETPSSSASPVELLERRHDVARLYELLDQLPEKYRTVLILFELEGKSGEEIAALMNAKVQTVWVWLHRARRRMLAEGGF